MGALKYILIAIFCYICSKYPIILGILIILFILSIYCIVVLVGRTSSSFSVAPWDKVKYAYDFCINEFDENQLSDNNYLMQCYMRLKNATLEYVIVDDNGNLKCNKPNLTNEELEVYNTYKIVYDRYRKQIKGTPFEHDLDCCFF